MMNFINIIQYQFVTFKFFLASSIKSVEYFFDLANQLTNNGSIGIQCPPTPGPGLKGLNPKGFVDAASITSWIFIPLFEHKIYKLIH